MSFPPIFDLCSQDADLRSLLGQRLRLFPFGEAPQGVTYPYAVWQTVYGSPENYLADRADMDAIGTQIDVYSDTAVQARDVSEAIRGAIEGAAYVTAFNGESVDPVTRKYRDSFTVDWLVSR